VDDTILVRRLEPLGNLHGDPQRLFERQRPRLHLVVEILSGDQLHRHEPHPLGLVQAADRGDVGWLSDASRRASRSNRVSRSASWAKRSGRIFTATGRLRVVSSAFQTTPMPPSPIFPARQIVQQTPALLELPCESPRVEGCARRRPHRRHGGTHHTTPCGQEWQQRPLGEVTLRADGWRPIPGRGRRAPSGQERRAGSGRGRRGDPLGGRATPPPPVKETQH